MVKQYPVRIRDYPYTIREQGEGVPFIWLHGMFHSLKSEEYFSVFDFELLSRYVRLIRIELPSHGDSPRQPDPERLTWPSIAGDLRELTEKLSLDRYFLGGFSQGAGISAHVALDNQAVAGLALMMLPKIWNERPDIRNTYQKLIKQLEHGRNDRMMERIFGITRYMPVHAGWQREVAEKINQCMLQMTSETCMTILQGAILSDMPDPEKMSAGSVPLLLGGWQEDSNHPYTIYENIKQVARPEVSFLMDAKLGVKPATFRLLSFIFTYL